MANMGEPLVVMEPGGVISFMNAAALKVLGEHTGRRCHELMVGRHDPCPDCPLPWDSSDNWTYRYIRESATGRIRDVVASSLPTDDGPAVVAIIRDITEERLMHDYLAKHELMSAMGEMASGVAHNFNNILTGILGTVDDLKRQPTLEKMYPAMMVIERAAIDGTDLIRRLQASSRTSEEPGQVIDLRTVIQDAVHVTRPRWKSQAERAGRAIEVEARAAKGLTVRGQPAELRQVFINLILNAIDALPDGGRIEIVAAAADGTVEARVSDDGIGMTKEVMAKLFQPFFTTKGQKGSGLGLSTVYNILRNHGGGITVDSAPGIGTTFTVTLPLCEPTEEAADEVGPTALDERGEPGQVLIVDDDLLVLEVLASLVAAGGHQVKTANRGADALQMLAEVPFDVIVTDLGMPEMSGWQVAEGARKLRPQTGIVLLTGWGANLGDDENRRALVDLVLAKPVRVDELLAAVARVRRMRLNPRANEQPA
jgi:signal transduction histidine kinase/CheY-like chemotaxis protein